MDELFLFDGLSGEARQALCAMLPPAEHFEKGDVIYGGERCGAIGVLLSGKAECVAQSGGVLMRVFEAGEVFGAASVFENDAASRMTATTACCVQYIPRETLLRWFSLHTCVAVSYIRFLSSKVRFLNRKIALLTMDSAQTRLMEYLLAHADENGCVTARNMSQLAKTIGVGRTSLYRSLDALCACGWIVREDHQIIIREKQI